VCECVRVCVCVRLCMCVCACEMREGVFVCSYVCMHQRFERLYVGLS